MLESLQSKHDRSPTILEWEKINEPSPDLIYKSGLSYQAKALYSLPNVIYSKLEMPRVVSRHSSKSVGLPVSCYKLQYDCGFIFLRDNFYDIKLAVVSKFPVTMPYRLVHREYTPEEYEAERQRAIAYCSRSSDFDPKPYESDAWMTKWSHDSIIRTDGKIWRASCVYSVYCEGMSEVLPEKVFVPFENGKSEFTCALGTYAQAGVVIDAIQASNERERYKAIHGK